MPSSSCRLRLPPAPVLLRSQEHLQDAFFPSAFHRMDPLSERILFTYQAVDVDRAFLQKIERRLESAAARTHYRDLINHEPRLIDLVNLAWSLKGRLQHQGAPRSQ